VAEHVGEGCIEVFVLRGEVEVGVERAMRLLDEVSLV